MSRADATRQSLRFAALAGAIEFGDDGERCAAGAKVGGSCRGAAPLPRSPVAGPRVLGELLAMRFAGLRRELLRSMLLASATEATPEELDELAARTLRLWVPITAQYNATITLLAASLRESLGSHGPTVGPGEEMPHWSSVLEASLLALDPDLHTHLMASIAGFEAERPPELLCAGYEDCERYGAAVGLLLANAAIHERSDDAPGTGLLGSTAHCEPSAPLSLASLCLDFVSSFPDDAGMHVLSRQLLDALLADVEVSDGVLRLANEYLAARDPEVFASLCARFPSCVTPRGV